MVTLALASAGASVVTAPSGGVAKLTRSKPVRVAVPEQDIGSALVHVTPAHRKAQEDTDVTPACREGQEGMLRQ